MLIFENSPWIFIFNHHVYLIPMYFNPNKQGQKDNGTPLSFIYMLEVWEEALMMMNIAEALKEHEIYNWTSEKEDEKH